MPNQPNELEELKKRIAELESKQENLEKKQSADSKLKTKLQPVATFFKKYGLKVVLPVTLVLIVFIVLMTSFVGVRGVYVSADNPNNFYEFTATKYTSVSEDEWGEIREEGKWKTGGGRITFTVVDEDFGKISDDFSFSRNGYKKIFIDGIEYNRVSLVKLKYASKIKINIDLQGGQAEDYNNQTKISLGQKIKEPTKLEKLGYTFKGWYTSKYGFWDGEESVDFENRFWNDITIYANWQNNTEFTITSELFDDISLYANTNLLELLKSKEEGTIGTYQYRLSASSDWITIDENTRMPESNIEVRWINPFRKIVDTSLSASEKAQYNTNGYYRSGNYIWFGEYPQTIKANKVTVGETADSRGYYLGDDGEYYAKVTATPRISISGYKLFSTGSEVSNGTVYYFKVEPIIWRILSESGNNALILCESIIVNKRFDDDKNNYAESEIREWLNAEFYNTAFSTLQQALIQTTEVDNSAYTYRTGYEYNEYACENTYDKIFLPSYREMVNTDYGFSSSFFNSTARERLTSDYSIATGADMSTSPYDYGNGWWWLRSPTNHTSYHAHTVDRAGDIFGYSYVSYADGGVVPALTIQLS